MPSPFHYLQLSTISVSPSFFDKVSGCYELPQSLSSALMKPTSLWSLGEDVILGDNDPKILAPAYSKTCQRLVSTICGRDFLLALNCDY